MAKKKRRIQIHDRVIKETLEYIEEFRDYIKDFLNMEIEVKDLEVQNKEYRINKHLSTRYIDILYKIKDEESYILLEHQSTIDYRMGERINEDCLAIVESRNKYMERSKNRKAPVILPTVLCTANRRWDAPTTIEQIDENKYKIPKQKYPKYIVVNNSDYEIDDLIGKRTGISAVVAFEKVETKKDIDYIINKYKGLGKVNEREERAMRLIINNIEDVMPKLIKTLTKEEIEEIKEEMKEIIEREGDFMSNFEKAIAKIIKENEAAEAKGRAAGISIGEAKGRANTIFQVVKNMLNRHMKDEDIIECTNITKEELEKLKLQMA